MNKLIAIIMLITSVSYADTYIISNDDALELYERTYQREQEKNRKIREAYRNISIKQKQEKLQKIIEESQRNLR